jgi:glycosyltransferase involved in cell wall biosynthesis
MATVSVNLFGFLSANLGLGVTARHLLRQLLKEGATVHPVDVPDAAGRSGMVVDHPISLASPSAESPHDLNLFVLNPTSYVRLREESPPALQTCGRINAILPFWELPRIPGTWLPVLETMDGVLTASRFVHHTIAAEVSGPFVARVPHPLHLPRGVRANRQAFGLPRDRVVFASSFELASDVNRKNPFGAIEAFQRAFPEGDRSAILALKLNNPGTRSSFRPWVQRLRQAARIDDRIHILDGVMNRREVLSFYASADVYVSLHRAEGLGLSLLESMALGKPVVATAWSGNMEYMRETNSCLVGYDLIPAKGATHDSYDPAHLRGAVWAEPHLDEAASWMAGLARNEELRRHIGGEARKVRAERERETSTFELTAVLERLHRSVPASVSKG